MNALQVPHRIKAITRRDAATRQNICQTSQQIILIRIAHPIDRAGIEIREAAERIVLVVQGHRGSASPGVGFGDQPVQTVIHKAIRTARIHQVRPQAEDTVPISGVVAEGAAIDQPTIDVVRIGDDDIIKIRLANLVTGQIVGKPFVLAAGQSPASLSSQGVIFEGGAVPVGVRLLDHVPLFIVAIDRCHRLRGPKGQGHGGQQAPEIIGVGGRNPGLIGLLDLPSESVVVSELAHCAAAGGIIHFLQPVGAANCCNGLCHGKVLIKESKIHGGNLINKTLTNVRGKACRLESPFLPYSFVIRSNSSPFNSFGAASKK